MSTNGYLKYIGTAVCLVLLTSAATTWSQGRRPSGHCVVGRLVRPLGIPLVSAVLPNHHDVIVRERNSLETNRRGFFADDFIEALTGFRVWLATVERGLPSEITKHIGWVPGHIADEGKWGREQVDRASYERYLTVYNRMTTSTSNRYHLAIFNCQTWATEQLQP